MWNVITVLTWRSQILSWRRRRRLYVEQPSALGLFKYRNLAFKERALTDFVLVLNTSMDPDDVPIKICLPVGSKRATVIADLRYPRRPSVEFK